MCIKSHQNTIVACIPCCFTLGKKLKILVFLRVLRAESQYFYLYRYCFGLEKQHHDHSVLEIKCGLLLGKKNPAHEIGLYYMGVPSPKTSVCFPIQFMWCSQRNFPLSFQKLCIHMHMTDTKFERNSYLSKPEIRLDNKLSRAMSHDLYSWEYKNKSTAHTVKFWK